METLHITTAADLISLIGHSLGYWPHEGLVCISLQSNRMGATLRLNLPSSPEHARAYAKCVAGHLGSDEDATATVFAIVTDAPWTAQRREFLRRIIHEVAHQLAQSGMPIRAGCTVRPSSFAEYQPHTASYGPEVPLEAVQSSCINAEIVFRSSQVEDRFTVAVPTQPRGQSPTTSDAGNPQRRRPAPSLPASHARRLSPLRSLPDDAPEESRTTKIREHALAVMSKTAHAGMNRYD